MKKSGVSLIAFVIVGLFFGGCGWKKQVADSGFVPLEDLDLIQVHPDDRTNSEMVVLGTALPWRGLSGWPLFTKTLRTANNPLRPTYSFKAKVVPGPSQFQVDRKTTISASALRLGTWANVGLSGTAKDNIRLNNLLHGYLEIADDGDQIPLFIAIEPLGLDKTEDEILWITEFLAADVDNFSDLGLTAGAGVPIDSFPVDVKLSDGTQVTLKGPGLVLGVKGQIATSKRTGLIPETQLPASGPLNVTVPLSGAGGSWTLVTHRNGNDVQFQIAELAGAIAFVKDKHDNWRKDTSPNATVVANLAPATRSIAAAIGDGITRVILVKTQLGSGRHVVASLVVINDQGTYKLSGQAYEISMSKLTY
jgi:hypothetical protein